MPGAKAPSLPCLGRVGLLGFVSMRWALGASAAGLLVGLRPVGEPRVRFQEHTITTDLPGGYQVLPYDVNQDGRPDIIALSTKLKELLWFENPTWERHVLAGGLSRMINVAARDAGASQELVVAHEFANDPSRSTGVISLLRRGKGGAWTSTEIDRLPTSHRLRFADIDGSGRKVLVNAPLAGSKGGPPEYRDKVPLVFYRPGLWKREPISSDLEGVLHGLTIVDWGGDGRDALLTAGFLGLDLFRWDKKGWSRTLLAKGELKPWPASGSSDTAVGRLGGERFIAAIEPWHGNHVVVYLFRRGEWKRNVIDDTIVDGHALVVADLLGDGRDEIIVGFRGGAQSVFVYWPSANGEHWTRQVLDAGGMAAANCAVFDVNQDGRPDIVCIGAATGNLKWYENLGPS